MLPDQPLVTTAYLKEMITTYKQKNSQIVVTTYKGGKTGVPALFDASYTNNLMQLTKDVGAKSIIEENKKHVIILTPKCDLTDIDTLDDYNSLINTI